MKHFVKIVKQAGIIKIRNIWQIVKCTALPIGLKSTTVDQGYNKYVNKFKSLSNHKIAMHNGKTRYQRMILYHQNVSESLQTHQNASEALKLDKWY